MSCKIPKGRNGVVGKIKSLVLGCRVERLAGLRVQIKLDMRDLEKCTDAHPTYFPSLWVGITLSTLVDLASLDPFNMNRTSGQRVFGKPPII